MTNIFKRIVFACSITVLTLSLPACGIGGDDPTENSSSSSSNKHSNAKVSINNASIKKLSGQSNYQITYTIKASGVSSSEISEIGCTSNQNPSRYSSSKTGVTSYSYSSKGTSVNAYLTPYIKFKDGEKIAGAKKFVSANQ